MRLFLIMFFSILLLTAGKVPADRNEASAFLSRATFGPDKASIDRLMEIGIDAWLDEQFALPASSHMQWMLDRAKGVDGTGDLRDHPGHWTRYNEAIDELKLDAWWKIVVTAPDQLRQRVAFALSEILVTSKYGPLLTYPDARTSFYDLLVRHAFGRFEDLLLAVTYHPAMGLYLSYLGNAKAGMIGAHPDENYAREVMQLFSIGLVRLHPDGTPILDESGRPLPAYTQHDVTELARVFTGLSDRNGQFLAESAFSSHQGRIRPMRIFEHYHDHGAKTILGHPFDANVSAREEIRHAIHILATHPNTAPFISRQLIQRLVTSNPGPDYVKRVARVFRESDGDLKAVVRAILTDDEALHGRTTLPKRFGKFREPLLMIAHLLRAFHAVDGLHTLKEGEKPLYRYRSFNLHETGMMLQDSPQSALTVFNYFTPDDAPTDLARKGLVAPELSVYGKQGVDDVLMGIIHQNGFIYDTFELSADLQIGPIRKLIRQKRYQAALNRLDTLLCGGTLSRQSRQTILTYLRKVAPRTRPDALARHLIGLVITSPDYALQR